jgi:hypothetical protein
MTNRFATSITALMLIVIGLAWLAPTPIAGQSTRPGTRSWTPPRTSWGDPDLQGTWTNTTTTPFEGPTDRGKGCAERRGARQPGSRGRLPASALTTGRSQAAQAGTNEFWVERGRLSKQTFRPAGREGSAPDGGGSEATESITSSRGIAPMKGLPERRTDNRDFPAVAAAHDRKIERAIRD